MAKRIYSEDLVLNLIINAKDMPAQSRTAINELHKLDRATRELEKKLIENERAQKSLDKTAANYSQTLRRLQKEHAALTRDINQNHAEMNRLRQDIGRTGMTINQLNSYLRVLKIQLNNATDPSTMKRLRREIELTEIRIRQLTTGASRMSLAFERMGTIANKFGTLMGWIGIAVYVFARVVGSTVKNLRDLDKQFSNVMKSTELTRAEMWQLKRQFDELNKDENLRTPTKTNDLLEISRIAGRLGVRGVKDIAEFTMAVDKLYVALGEDLKGSVEEVAEKVGKLVNVFRLTDTMPLGEAMLRAGSLINELGKSSAASAETILNYTARLGGVGSMAKFSMDQLAGLGAALDAMNVPAERGSTALVKLINGLGQHAEQFSRMLGYTVEEYNERLKTDVNGVLLELIEASGKGNESIMEVVQGMGDMEVSGVRVAEVYGKLVQNMDMVRKQQEIAARAFSSSASVMNEFYIMSKDFDSLMALQGKRWKALEDEYSRGVAPAVYRLYKLFTDIAYRIKDVVLWIGKHLNLLGALIALWTAFKSVAIVRTIAGIYTSIDIWTRALGRNIQANLLHNATLKSMYIAYHMAGGGIKGVIAALQSLKAAMIANPWTAALAIISLVAGALFLMRKRTDEVSTAIDNMKSEITKQTSAMQFLFNAAMKTNEGTKQRKDLIDKINILYGEYLPKLLSEKDSVKDIADAYLYANKQLERKIRLEAQQSSFADIMGKKEEKLSKMIEVLFSSVKDDFKRGTLKESFRIFLDEMMDWGAHSGEMTDEAFEKISKFLSDYGLKVKEGGDSISAIIKYIYERRLEIEKVREKFSAEIAGMDRVWEEHMAKAGAGFTPLISDSEYQSQVKEAEAARDAQLLRVKTQALEQKKNNEWLKKEELKAEEQHIRNLIEIETKRWTAIQKITENGAEKITASKLLSESEGPLRELQLKLVENLMSQQGDGRKGSITNAMKDQLLEAKVTLLKMLDDRVITQEMYNSLMLMAEEDYYTVMIAKAKKSGEDTLQYEEQLYQTRLKIRENFKKQGEYTFEGIIDAFKLKPEEEDEDANRWAKTFNDRRKRIRQAMGVEKNEDTESELAVFDTQDFDAQLAQLDEFHRLGILNHNEYEKVKTDITRKQTEQRLKFTKDFLGATNDLLAAAGSYYEAQKERELKLAGDNETKKDAINRKYARKQQNIQVAQAFIKGASAIMDLWGNNAIPFPFREIYNAIMIPIILATTAMQVGTIKAQQFAKGNYPVDILRKYAKGYYPVRGADDGKTYQAKYVGSPRTGIYQKPSLGLFAEKPEMVIDNGTLRNIQLNSPRLIEAINAHRPGGSGAVPNNTVRQYAAGNYPDTSHSSPAGDDEMKIILREVRTALNEFRRWKPTVYTEQIKKDLDELQNIESRRGM